MRIVGNIALVCAIIAPASFADVSGDRGVVVADPCDKPCITEIGGVPWTPPVPHARPKVIYGEDDRIDVYQETDVDRLKWAASTCALINLNRLTQHADGSWTISSPSAYTRWGLPACEDEPFGDQPSAAFCSGFMVGEDLIVTAGHCYNTNSLASVRFVFGFWMLDETTPRLDFLESEVYQGVEVVSYASSGTYDHSVVRVDRPITTPGAEPFLLRRTGVVEAGEYVGVIGHPAGLPMKIAFGDTYVRAADMDGYFVANLDTYGGNSGSPVINTFTGMLEGILVRGATDFIQDYENNCFYSNVYPNDGGRGEDVTKATVFAPYVPGPEGNQGVLSLDAAYYFCDDIVTVTVVDVDLEGETSIAVDMNTASGDMETLTLPVDSETPSRFEAAIMVVPGTAAPDSGALDVIQGDVISAFYLDEVSETGMPQMRVETAVVDCEPPQITNVQVAFVSGTQVQIHVATDETATVTIHFGEACDSLAYVSNSAWNMEHVISLSGFAPDTAYYFAVAAEDRAGNGSYVDNAGACYSFVTYSSLNCYTEYFTLSNPVDLNYRQATFTPYDHPNHYQACITSVIALPVAPGGEQISLGDDAYVEVPFTHGAPITFYGADYDRMYVGSNGYITFGAGDDTYQPMYSLHFQMPRISGFMCDLNPARRGAVYCERGPDSYIVTFMNVPVYSSSGQYPPENNHTFQMELFFDGVIRVTWQNLYATNVVVGLSAGLGVPPDFESEDFTGFEDCEGGYSGDYHSADINGDWQISLDELLLVVQLYSIGEYHCDEGTSDGYAPGSGVRDCSPHNSDYAPADWRVNIRELLRLIQLYNAGGYRPDDASEDGFSVVM